MKILVGSTGFVGSNLSSQTKFDGLYNSKNISESFGLNPELLVYSGVRAEKFLANSEPDRDLDIIKNAIGNIISINPQKIVLISTVDVYPNPVLVDENSEIEADQPQAYGRNRLYLEKWVENNFEDYLIIRLPALFGNNLKKNFIYDLIHIIPAMINESKFLELSEANDWIGTYYSRNENSFYKLNAVSESEKSELKEKFFSIGFTALNFTDSRGVFQFYNLDHLWADIETALSNTIKKLNLATEPITVNEIYQSIYQKEFKNEIAAVAPRYDFRTIHGKLFGNGHYIRSKQDILAAIKNFITDSTKS